MTQPAQSSGVERIHIPCPVIQDDGQITKGFPPDRSIEGIELCPLCGADLKDDFIPGFGLAYGGYGTYWYCTSDDCPWFYKEMEMFS